MSVRFYIGHLVPNYIFTTVPNEGLFYRTSEQADVARLANLIVQVEDDGEIMIVKDKRFYEKSSSTDYKDWISKKHLTMLRMGLLPKHIKEAYVTNINFNYKYNSQFNII